MKHADCGGELKKSKKRAGRYRCTKCRAIVHVGERVYTPLWAEKLKA